MQIRFVFLLASVLALASTARDLALNAKQTASRLVLGDRPRLVIGASVNDPADELAWVIGATKLSDGRIAIADRGNYQVRLYDRNGRLLSRVGRRGEGPGDFNVMERFWRGAGDSLFVFDYMLQRIQVIAPTGRFVRVWPSLSKLGGSLHAVGDYSDGGVLFEYRIPSALPRVTGLKSYDVALYRVSANFQLVDTIGSFFGGETLVLMRDGRSTGSSHVPLGRYGFATARGDETFYLDGATKDVKRFSGVDQTQPALRLEGVASPLTSNEREVRISEYLETLGTMSPTFLGSVKEALARDLDRAAPLFDSLFVDRVGRVWTREVRRPTPSEAQWLVSTLGRPSAMKIRLSSGWRLLEAGADYLLVADQNDRGRAAVMEYSLVERK